MVIVEPGGCVGRNKIINKGNYFEFHVYKHRRLHITDLANIVFRYAFEGQVLRTVIDASRILIAFAIVKINLFIAIADHVHQYFFVLALANTT